LEESAGDDGGAFIAVAAAAVPSAISSKRNLLGKTFGMFTLVRLEILQT
jgi:hypothetical protein